MLVWDLSSGAPISPPFTGHTGRVNAVALGSHNGRPFAVTGGDDRTVRVWDPSGGRPIGWPLTGHTGAVTAVALGTLSDRPVAVTGGDDATVRVWDLGSGQPIGRPLIGHTGAVTAVALGTLSDRPVAVTGGDDATVRVWDLAQLQPYWRRILSRLRLCRVQPRSIGTHADKVTAIALQQRVGGHPVLISGSVDQSVHLRDLDGSLSLRIELDAPVVALTSADPGWLILATTRGLVALELHRTDRVSRLPPDIEGTLRRS